MPQQRESRPAANRTASQNTISDTDKSSLLPSQPRREPLGESANTPRCKRCKRPLIRDVSVTRGCGWRCARHLAAATNDAGAPE